MTMTEDLARSVTVLILGGGRGSRLFPLTQRRSKPAVPVASKYRLIDIPISNAINSQMERMYVLTQFNSVSLHRHIGRAYRFDAFSKGYVQILAAQQTPDAQTWFQGTADAVRQNIRVFRELQGEYVLILAGDHMYRMDYRQLLQDHVNTNADITVGVMPCSSDEIGDFGAARVDEEGRIITVSARQHYPVKFMCELLHLCPEALGMSVDPVVSHGPFLKSCLSYSYKFTKLYGNLCATGPICWNCNCRNKIDENRIFDKVGASFYTGT